MRWFIRLSILKGGERFPLLVQDSPYGIPDTEVTRYTLTHLRPVNAVTTITRKLSSLGRGRAFCHERDLDIVSRTVSGEFLSVEELYAFSETCRLRIDGNGLVGNAVAAEVFQSFLSFIDWKIEPVIARIIDDERRAAVRVAFEAFRKRAAIAKPSMQGPAGSETYLDERSGLKREQRLIFLRVITPGSDENPWHEDHQLRNYAMLMTAYRLGVRTGELLGLKVRDFNQITSPASLTFHRRHDDHEDPRARQPVAKTLPRLLNVDDDHRDLLHTWVFEHRSDTRRYARARKTPFLFVNKAGDPLCVGGYQKMVRSIGKRHRELEGLVNHVLRHDFNERFVEQGEIDGRDPIETAELQRIANGWGPESNSPLNYSKTALRKRSNDRILAVARQAING